MVRRDGSPLARDAIHVLGESIRVARLRRRWTTADLAERAGVSRATISKVEHGDPSVSIGTFFEAATLVGVPLFEDETTRRRHAAHQRAELALLPGRARQVGRPVDDNF